MYRELLKEFWELPLPVGVVEGESFWNEEGEEEVEFTVFSPDGYVLDWEEILGEGYRPLKEFLRRVEILIDWGGLRWVRLSRDEKTPS